MVNSVRAVIDRKQRFVAALFAFENFWTKSPEVERGIYEIFTAQAVCSTLTWAQQ